jgi:hypothetical protein
LLKKRSPKLFGDDFGAQMANHCLFLPMPYLGQLLAAAFPCTKTNAYAFLLIHRSADYRFGLPLQPSAGTVRPKFPRTCLLQHFGHGTSQTIE